MKQNIRTEIFFSKLIILWGSFLLFTSTLALIKLKPENFLSLASIYPIAQALIILLSGYALRKRIKIVTVLFVILFILGLVGMIRLSLNGFYGTGLIQVLVYGYLSLYCYFNRNTFV